MSSGSAARCDVAIVGGGMVGASLALALSTTRHAVLLLEATPIESAAQPSFDDRTTALGNGARRVLETLGVWDEIAVAAAAIRRIHVSDAGHFGFARLDAADHGLAAFGYAVTNRHIGAVLWDALSRAPRVELAAPARVVSVELAADGARLVIERTGREQRIEARLVVGADGAHSLIKQAAGIASSTDDYAQVALVASIRTDQRAQDLAFERFTDSGPVALLPRHDGAYTVVWTLAPERARAMRESSAQDFCRELQARFGWRAGRILEVGARSAYPLSLVRAEASSAERVALIGNAAQALHPVAAQGFNLGLRDAAALAELIAAADDPGAPELLRAYAERRSADRRGMIAFTDRLVRLFGDRRAAAVALRNLGLLLFDVAPPAKRALSRLSWGFGAALPRLSRGLPLS